MKVEINFRMEKFFSEEKLRQQQAKGMSGNQAVDTCAIFSLVQATQGFAFML